MTPMTPERFRQLTEAYGALPDHWPQEERAAAQALLAQHDPQALAAIEEALQLDEYLESFAVPAPDTHLIRQIIASAPASTAPRRASSFLRQPRLWFSGAGLIGAGVAGIAAGAMAISLTGSPAGTATNTNALGMVDQSYGGTVFSSTPPDWSDQ
jgi:hypothetical protein